MEPNYYDLLQVSPRADQPVIEAAYRGLAAKYEAAAATDPNAAGWLNALNQAYQVLRDPQRRSEYDRSLLGITPPATPPTLAPRPVAVVPPAPVSAPARLGLPVWLLGVLGLCIVLMLGGICVGVLVLRSVGGTASTLLNGSGSQPTIALVTATPANTPVSVATVPATRVVPNTGSILTNVVMATGTSGDNFDPVGITTTFDPAATLHAIATIVNAPANTTVRAVWFADNVAGSTAPNTKIDEYTLTTDGSRNLDFTLKPKTNWPNGTYHVDIYVDGNLVKTVPFSVAGGSGSNSNSKSATGLVQSATLARSVTPNVFDPVDPTTTFSPGDVTLHLVLAIANVPDNTAFQVTWYFGSQRIDSTTLNAGGTRNLDFTLKQNRAWPPGAYHVDVDVNGSRDQTVDFQVQ